MITSNVSTSALGWTGIAVGVIAILAVVFLTLMATVNSSFGKVNDVFNSLIGISSVILAWMLFAEHQVRSPLMSRIGLALAVLGMVFTIIGSILIIYSYTDFVLAGWYTGIGNALIGLWLAAICYTLLSGDALPRSLIIFGIVAGAFMAVGLIGIFGILAGIDNMKMPWYLYIAFFGYLGTYILYPIWAIRLGLILLSK